MFSCKGRKTDYFTQNTNSVIWNFYFYPFHNKRVRLEIMSIISWINNYFLIENRCINSLLIKSWMILYACIHIYKHQGKSAPVWVMIAYGEVEVLPHSFLTMALDEYKHNINFLHLLRKRSDLWRKALGTDICVIVLYNNNIIFETYLASDTGEQCAQKCALFSRQWSFIFVRF
jgi:hypothetical protein